MPNFNKDTGIAYGVISCNSLNSDLVQDLFYGYQAKDLSYQAAYEEAKREAQAAFESHTEEAHIAAAETGADREPGYDPDTFFERYCEKHEIDSDLDTFVDTWLERFSDCCQIEEPTIEGVYEGISYAILWLGGAPIVYITHSPHVVRVGSRCSPCVPGAGDLDSGLADDGYECYGIPPDWYLVPQETTQTSLF